MSCHVIHSVNDDNMTFVLGPSFFSFAAGGSVTSMVSLSFDTPSIISACHVLVFIIKSCHNRIYFVHLNNNGF